MNCGLLQRVDSERYRLRNVENLMTPALVVYPEIVTENIDLTLRLLEGYPNRWRPHLKTVKIESIVRRLVERGVVHVKCATTLEVSTALAAGAEDVLLAHLPIGANAARLRAIAGSHSRAAISALVECPAHVDQWKGSEIGLFIDVNAGMNRTGIGERQVEDVISLARYIQGCGLSFRGLHYYDGHLYAYPDMNEREVVAHQGYRQAVTLIEALDAEGLAVEELVTAGTPAFPASISFEPFREASFMHRVSPGTVLFGDINSFRELPELREYRPAALVVSTVISQPTERLVTCDAGHKTVSADAGVPTCCVLGYPEIEPQKPSEEHLPLLVPADGRVPAIGEVLYLVPRHVCPTVNNFDHVLMAVGHSVVVERVQARGREYPLLPGEDSPLRGNP
ncbi:MAG: alanine racemase [Bdellovibrionales bacterium]|nr:alanine racemase [Bdellovibrionales bacterium]